MAERPYLPFARPTLDDATIADVGDVLRSGWITTAERLFISISAAASASAPDTPM